MSEKCQTLCACGCRSWAAPCTLLTHSQPQLDFTILPHLFQYWLYHTSAPISLQNKHCTVEKKETPFVFLSDPIHPLVVHQGTTAGMRPCATRGFIFLINKSATHLRKSVVAFFLVRKRFGVSEKQNQNLSQPVRHSTFLGIPSKISVDVTKKDDYFPP